jgi:hypothetical protein
MAMLGPEAIHSVPRIAPVHLEMRMAYVEAPVARELGLHDGQVVQATVATDQGQLKLVLNNHIFNIPLSPYIKDGDMVQLRAQLLPAGKWVLQLLHSGSFAGPDPSAGQLPTTAVPSRLSALLFQPGGFANVFSLLQPGVLESLVPPVEGGAELKKRIAAQRLSMGALQPQTLKRWLLGHLKSGEANLLDGDVAVDDTKALLRLLVNERARAGSQESADLHARLQNALDEVESAQVQAAQDWQKGDLRYALVIPFRDADPLEMKFERKGNRPGQPKNPLIVNMHTQSRVLGEVWLKTTIYEGAKVDLTMWALNKDIAEQARFNASELTYELENAGLVMGSFQVYNAPRPDAQEERAPPPHGALVDTQA